MAAGRSVLGTDRTRVGDWQMQNADADVKSSVQIALADLSTGATGFLGVIWHCLAERGAEFAAPVRLAVICEPRWGSRRAGYGDLLAPESFRGGSGGM